jgi:hypothetical protein
MTRSTSMHTVRLAALAAALLALGTAAARPAVAGPLTDADREQLVALAKAVAADPAVVAAVRSQNARRVPLAEIQQVDRLWTAAQGVDARMQALMGNTCARALKQAQADHPEIAEAFAMDNQGANVCMTNRTSDYWQGDEAKWVKSFDEGRGAVFVDAPKFDDSAGGYLVQVSVPVMAGGKAIGAVTVGVSLDRIATQRH